MFLYKSVLRNIYGYIVSQKSSNEIVYIFAFSPGSCYGYDFG